MPRRSLLEIPSGVQCFLGREARHRREVERLAADVFRGWSYEEIVLPLFDFDDVFTRGGATAATSGRYRFIGRDGEVMALRPDFTALVAKVFVSRLSRRELPLRLFYSGEVLRYQPPRAGQQEELFQVGLEHLGSDSIASDLEVLLVAFEVLARLGIQDAVLTLGHVGLAMGLLSGAGELERRAAFEAMRRHDREGVERSLGPSGAAAWLALSALTGGVEVLEEARRLPALAGSRDALERLERIVARLRDLGLDGRLRLDLGEVRDFEYYTGVVFDLHAAGSGLELGGGGRYDNLVGRFGREVPAIGFYLSLDRLSELLAKRGSAPAEDEAVLATGLKEALEARRAGKNVKVAGW